MSENGDGAATPGSEGLARRFLVGGVYLGAGNWISYALNFALMLGIARFMGPSELGLYTFVFAINEFLNIVGAFSLGVVLIQAREADQQLYDTAFAILVALGTVGLLAGIPIAFVLAEQRSADAAWLLMSLCLVRLFRLLSQVPQAKLEREFRYGPVTVISFVTGNLPNLFAIGFAWAGWGAWSLVARDLLSTTSLLAMSLVWSGYWFRFQVARESAREIMKMARNLFTAMSVGLVTERVDRVSIGMFLGDVATGLYQQARFLSEVGLLAMRPVSRLSINLYARLQDDPVRLSRSFSLLNYVMVRMLCAGAVALLTFPEDVILILLGAEWLEAAPLLRWFGVFSITYALGDNPRSLFMGMGESRLFVQLAVVQAAMTVPAVLFSAIFGSVEHVAASVVVASVLAYGYAWFQSGKLVTASAWAILGVPVLLMAGVAVGLNRLAEHGLFDGVSSLVRIVLPVLVYLAGLLAIERGRLWKEFQFLRSQL